MAVTWRHSHDSAFVTDTGHPGLPQRGAGGHRGSSPGSRRSGRTRHRTARLPRRPSSAKRTSSLSPATRPDSPEPGSPPASRETAHRVLSGHRADCPFKSLVVLEGSAGGHFAFARHARGLDSRGCSRTRNVGRWDLGPILTGPLPCEAVAARTNTSGNTTRWFAGTDSVHRPDCFSRPSAQRQILSDRKV